MIKSRSSQGGRVFLILPLMREIKSYYDKKRRSAKKVLDQKRRARKNAVKKNSRKVDVSGNCFWEKYRAYLRSDEWACKRDLAIRTWGNECQLCGSSKNIQIHHRTYDRVFNEDVDDLMVVCAKCHSDIHGGFNKRKR